MHKDWEELIPFYVAGSLARPDTSRLENHLARCENCRRSVEEWRAIAAVVRSDAAAQIGELPPLSSRVLQVATREAGGRRARLHLEADARTARAVAVPARRSASITLAAAVFTVVILGGLLALLVLRGTVLGPQPGAESVVLLPTATPFSTETAQGTSTPLASGTPVPQIIIIEPSSTPETPASKLPSETSVIVTAPPVFVPPTNPPTQPLPTAVPPQIIPPTEDASIYSLSLPVESSPEPLVLTPEPSLEAFSMLAPDLPTPTAYTGAPMVIISASTANLREGPGTVYPIIGLAVSGDELLVTAQARTSSGVWYLVEQLGTGMAWVSAITVQVVPANAFVPAAATVPPTPAPSATVIPFMSTSTPVSGAQP